MRAVREFNVVPAVPAALAPLSELAFNLHWTWDRETQQLFESLDPGLWKSTGRDPLRLLAAISAARWAALAGNPDIVSATNAASERLRDAVEAPRWFQGRRDSPVGTGNGRDDHLGDAVAPVYREGLLAHVDEDDAERHIDEAERDERQDGQDDLGPAGDGHAAYTLSSAPERRTATR